jgi:surfeit locus 1 family protein
MAGDTPDTKGQPGLAAAALFGLCPQCGAKGLFAGATKFAPKCGTCGLDYSRFNVGDGPAAFLTLIIGAITGGPRLLGRSEICPTAVAPRCAVDTVRGRRNALGPQGFESRAAGRRVSPPCWGSWWQRFARRLMLKRLPLIPTLLVLAAVAVMVRLGFWQLDRMHQKDAMVAEFTAALESPSAEFDLNRDQLIDYPDPYVPVTVHCTSAGPDRPKSGRNLAGEAGWAHVFACRYTSPRGKQAEVRVIAGWSKAPLVANWQGGKVSGIVAPESMTERWKWHIIADPPLAGLAANARPDPPTSPTTTGPMRFSGSCSRLVALVIYAWRCASACLAAEPWTTSAPEAALRRSISKARRWPGSPRRRALRAARMAALFRGGDRRDGGPALCRTGRSGSCSRSWATA